jgi:type II secretory pathway pseudopilin PulG
MELLVVLSILALFAALAVPKLLDLYERSRSSTQAYSIADVSRQIELFSAANHKYPDGWDSLMTDGGGIYAKLAPEIESPNTFLTTTTISSDQVTSLNSAGIAHVFLHDTSVADASSSGIDRRHLGTGSGHDGTANINTLVVINTAAGSDGLNMLINDFGLNPNRSATDTTLPRISSHTYVVLGLGPKSTLVQTQLQDAPHLEHATSASNYSRALAVFEVPNTGTTKAKLVGVFGPDGRSKRVCIQDFNSTSGVQSH